MRIMRHALPAIVVWMRTHQICMRTRGQAGVHHNMCFQCTHKLAYFIDYRVCHVCVCVVRVANDDDARWSRASGISLSNKCVHEGQRTHTHSHASDVLRACSQYVAHMSNRASAVIMIDYGNLPPALDLIVCNLTHQAAGSHSSRTPLEPWLWTVCVLDISGQLNTRSINKTSSA